MLLRYVFLSVLGLSFGLMAAGGVFTVLIAVGLIPRFAGKTHTAEHVLLYENMVILGTLFGGLVSVYEWGDLVGRIVVQDWGVPYMAWRIAGSVFLLLYGF
ncbi:MAG: stage V sporulation protein AB, partial [Lachnospiraceae bacterium]